jgi:hypothetical protein
MRTTMTIAEMAEQAGSAVDIYALLGDGIGEVAVVKGQRTESGGVLLTYDIGSDHLRSHLYSDPSERYVVKVYR